jgi:hypothetical protein
MADKDTVALIKKHDEERAGRFVELCGQGLHAGLMFLVEDYRRVAELYATAQLRGGKALQGECRAVASKLALLARGVEQAERTAVPQQAVPERGEFREVAPLASAPHLNAGLDETPHKFVPTDQDAGQYCSAEVVRNDETVKCGRYASHPAHRMTSPPPAGSPEGLERLVTDRANPRNEPGSVLTPDEALRESMTIDPSVGPDFTGGAFTEAVLAARSDAERLVEGLMFQLSDPAPIPAPQRAGDRCPDCGETADVPSVCADDWHGRPVPAAGMVVPTLSDPAAIPGERFTWDKLTMVLNLPAADPLTALGLPEHLSHSQIETLRECGTKYLLQRAENTGVVQVPQWSLVGGTAFHAAAEWFERTVLEAGNAETVGAILNTRGGIGEVWRTILGQTITDEAIANPLVPVDQWRAARKGAEGYTWWLVEGEAMLQKYIAMRMDELLTLDTAPWRRIWWRTEGERDVAMIENESEMDVNGVPFKVVLDQVWQVTRDNGPMRIGDLLIDDLKSGRTLPVETGQLQEYALWLDRQLHGADTTRADGNPPAIWGRFYDARKGVYTEPVDLLERADWRRFSYEVAAADRRKRGGIFDPQPSSFCGGCSVKHACPVFASVAS